MNFYHHFQVSICLKDSSFGLDIKYKHKLCEAELRPLKIHRKH